MFDLYPIQADDFDVFEPTDADYEYVEPDQCEKCGEYLPAWSLSPLCDRCDFAEYMVEMGAIG